MDGNTTRTDYVDDYGKITIAADYGFATKIITRTHDGEYEEYLDDQGEPISRYSGYYKVHREYDDIGNLSRITYLNLEDEPVYISDGYAIEEREYDTEKHLIAVHYLDTSGNPAMTASGYGKAYKYTEDGKISKITCLDFDGRPMAISLGYAILTRKYYETTDQNNGRVESEFYYDESGNPVALPLGQYGVHKEYDENGNETVLTYLDSNGNPIITNKGYTTIRRTYQVNNSIATEQYYDIDGEPYSIGEGQYGYKKVNGRVTYLGRNGREVFNIKTLLYNYSWMIVPCVILLTVFSCCVGRKSNTVLLLLYLIAIAYFTLMFRESGDVKSNLILFWSYKKIFVDSETRADIIRNIWLFIPLGTILYRLCPKRVILFVPVFISVAIELIQYFSCTGLCEIDDVISNGIGGVIGYRAGVGLTSTISRVKNLIKGRKSADSFRTREYMMDSSSVDTVHFFMISKMKNIETIMKGASSDDEDRLSLSSSAKASTWITICEAISASLLKKMIEVPDKVDWKAVFTESKKQSVVSIVGDGVKKYLPSSLATEWKLYSFQEISFGVQLLEAQKELTNLLDEHGVHHVILKGTAASIYYPEPYFRSMGDVDFWVPVESFDTTVALLKANGYIDLDSSNERHLMLRKANIIFEMHRHFSIDNVDKHIDQYIGAAEPVRGMIRDAEFWMLPELENGLILLDHLRQHLYEGLGLRQILDWMMYIRCCINSQNDWERFRKHAGTMGLERLALVATRLCQKYFGLKVTWAGPDDGTADMLLNSIIQSGNFGVNNGGGLPIEKTMIRFHKEGLFRYLQKAGEYNLRNILENHPLLRPFAWFYQICRYIRQAKRSGRIGGTFKDDLKRSNERYELLKALELL